MKTIEKILKIALYVTICVMGFGAIALISGGSLIGAFVFGAVLGLSIGTADVLICFMDYFTNFGKNLVSSLWKTMAFLTASVIVYAILSSAILGCGIFTQATWVYATSFVVIVMSPFVSNAVIYRWVT